MAKDLSLSVTLKAINKATGPLKKIMQGSQGVGRAMRETRDEMRDLQDQQKKITAFRDMSRKAHGTRRALMDQREELRQISEQLKNTTGPTKRLTQQQAKAQAAADKLSREYKDQRDSVRDLSRQLPEATRGTRGLTQQNDALEEQIRQTNNRLSAQREALGRLANADVSGRFSKMTGEIGRFGRRVAFAGTAAAGGIFALANSTATLGDDVAKTAAKLGLTNAELQELRYAGERSGVATSVLDSSMVAFTKRLGEAAGGSGAAVKGYDALGLSAERLAELPVSEAMAEVADKMKEIENPARRNATASQLFSRSGVGLVNMLKDGSKGLDEYARAARETGYQLSDNAAGGSETFKDALLDAQLAVKGAKNTIGAELMPAVTEVMQAFTGWMRENRDQVKAFAREFGSRLLAALPAMLDLARGAASFVGTLTSMVTSAAEAVGGFDNLAKILGVLFAGKMIASVVSFGAGIVKAAGAMGAFAKTLPVVGGAMRAVGVAMAATPIGWLIAGIAAVAVAAYLIYKHWEPIKEFFAGLWQQVKSAFGDGIGSVAKLLLNWSPFGLIWKSLVGAAEAVGIEVPALFKNLGTYVVDGLIGGITNGWAGLREAITSLGSQLCDWFKGVLGINSPSRVFAGFGTNIVEGIIGGIAGMIGALKDRVMGLAASIAGWMKDAIGSAWESGKNIAAGIGNGIKQGAKATAGAIKDGAAGAWQAGKDTARGLGDGIKSGAASVWQKARELAGGTEGAARKQLDTHSPSRVFRRIGSDVTAGLNRGLDDRRDEPARRVADIARRLTAAGAGMAIGTAAMAGPSAPALPALDAGGSIALDSRPAMAAPAAAAGAGLTINGGINISISATPGMDEQALAREVNTQVQRALEQAGRRAAAGRRRNLYDND